MVHPLGFLAPAASLCSFRWGVLEESRFQLSHRFFHGGATPLRLASLSGSSSSCAGTRASHGETPSLHTLLAGKRCWKLQHWLVAVART